MSSAGDGGMSPAPVRVKEEWIEIEIECGASKAAARASSSLYAEHEVKHELVLGPERLQPQDIAYATQKLLKTTDNAPVKQEREVKEFPGEELPVKEPCEDQYQFWTSFVKLERISNDKELHACLICQKTFDQKSSLVSHMCINTVENSCSNSVINKTETGHSKTEKTFICDTCGKCLARKFLLVRHMRIHTGKKLSTCQLCMKTFTRSCGLAKHRVVHTGEKPYSCEICKKRFTAKSNVTRHKLLHTRGRPYSCEICEKRFIMNFTLAAHRLIHTGEKPQNIERC